MTGCSMQDIQRLQDNLQTIRQVGGWTAEEFGEMIGVTKQTISNLENKRTAMTKTMYIAIRAVLDAEIKEMPENTALAQMVDLLLNSDDLSPEIREKARNAAAFASGARKSGIESAAITAGIVALMGAAFLTSPALLGITGAWLLPIIKRKGRSDS